MMNVAFPRLMKPPTPPRTRVEPHDMMHYAHGMDNHSAFGPRPRDRHAPGVSPIAHAIASQILSNHLNTPPVGVAHATQQGLQDGLYRQSLMGLFGQQQAAYPPDTGIGFGPPPPFSRL
jgi:hypothetical protein